MDTGPIFKLLKMKEADFATLATDISQVASALPELERRASDLRSALSVKRGAQQRLEEEIQLLRQAIGTSATASAQGMPTMPLTTEHTVEMRSHLDVPPVTIDLREIDFSDREPKVRQHTIEVRRRAVMILARSGPLATSGIIEAFEKDGFAVSRDKKVANLSAILSRTSFFDSIDRRWHLDVDKLLATKIKPK